mmetsp:Transcript_19182/g.17001  ORF Transcript_19182/g.17001 Transcript_19182/m.17001 type:complete len:190 (-) Transcript_19182:4-573(-)
MSVRIFAIKNENVEYKIQKAQGILGEVPKDIEEEYNRIKEQNEELKSRIDEFEQLENRYQRHSTADPMPDRNGVHVFRSRSPAPTYSKRDDLVSQKNIRDYSRNNEVPMFNNGSGTLTTNTQFYDNYASPATKSVISDRSWIDKNEINQNASNEQAQLIVEKLTKVINHLQTELAKNALLVEQLMEERD